MTERWTANEARAYFAKQPHQPSKQKGKGGNAKQEMEIVLQLMGVKYDTEYQFSKQRRFRFDFAIPEYKIGIEYEGLMSAKSRHTTVKGYTNDTTKYNLAQAEGWRVLRYTALNYRELTEDLKKVINL